jgi:hypothetical protein
LFREVFSLPHHLIVVFPSHACSRIVTVDSEPVFEQG